MEGKKESHRTECIHKAFRIHSGQKSMQKSRINYLDKPLKLWYLQAWKRPEICINLTVFKIFDYCGIVEGSSHGTYKSNG